MNPHPGDYGQLFLLDENIGLSALLKSFRNMNLGGSLRGCKVDLGGVGQRSGGVSMINVH